MKRWIFIGLLILVWGTGGLHWHESPDTPMAPAPLRIALQPFGNLDEAYLTLAQQEVALFYGAEVRVLPPIPLPDSAYYTPRQRYRAPILLRHLLQHRPKNVDFIAGLTSKDISTTKGEYKDWGILGLGYCPGHSCVVSTYRLGRSARNTAHRATRFSKVLLHELGHNLGLKHCTHAEDCLMRDACGSIKTIDNESKHLCTVCQKQIAHRVILPSSVED